MPSATLGQECRVTDRRRQGPKSVAGSCELSGRRTETGRPVGRGGMLVWQGSTLQFQSNPLSFAYLFLDHTLCMGETAKTLLTEHTQLSPLGYCLLLKPYKYILTYLTLYSGSFTGNVELRNTELECIDLNLKSKRRLFLAHSF